MALTVGDVLKLPCLQDARLVAGQKGLNKVVESVSVSECKEFPLDLQIVGEQNLLFGEHEFFLTSGYAIKDEPELLLDTIKLYNKYNSSGMCITNRYFKTISPQVIEYANDVNFPLISVKRETRYSAIIMEITRAILLNDKNAINETIIDELRDPGISIRKAKMLAYKLNPSFQRYSHGICASFDIPDKLQALSIMKGIQNSERIFAAAYQYYFIVIFSSETAMSGETRENNVKYIRSMLKSSFPDCSLGVSCVHEDASHIRDVIEESIIACEVAKMKNTSIEKYESVGAYKFLMRIHNKEVMNRFYNEMLAAVNEQSELKREEMINTLHLFVDCDGDVRRMSEEAFQHVNTIRYRIAKLKSLFGMEDSELEFITAVCLVHKIGRILEKEPEVGAEL